VELWPESIQKEIKSGMLPLHLACENRNACACINIIWYIFHLYPQAVRAQDYRQLCLPLHIICEKRAIPIKLVQHFVCKWPALIQMVGRYSKNSEPFSRYNDDLDAEIEEEYDGGWDHNNVKHNDESNDYDHEDGDTHVLNCHGYQDDDEDLDVSQNQEVDDAVDEDQYRKGDKKGDYIYALPLDLSCAV